MSPRPLLAVLALAVLAGACGEPPRPGAGGTFLGDLPGLLGEDDTAGFARAEAVREFHFPRDHGPHPAFRSEWWYVTGNLTADSGRRFGFQLTFFRLGLAPGRDERASRWATHRAWMAHFALTDARGRQFHAFERFGRGGGMNLAGARRGPVRVWLEDWELARDPDGRWRLDAQAEGISLELELDPAKAPVLQGDRGLSRKSAAPGDASYYYSLTRLEAAGRLSLGDSRFFVAGTAWLDREWGTSALGPELAGWDWFALQLDDGTDVMIYRLRRKDGSTSPWSAGSVVDGRGNVTPMDPGDFSIEALAEWNSPRGGAYPARWRLRIEPLDASLTVVPVLADQELDASVRYWEGAVDVLSEGGKIGVGYVELTGYAAGTK